MKTYLFSDFGLLVTATAIAGLLSYSLNILVKREVSDESFVEFAVFWGATYFGVGLLSGLQQEVTRASTKTVGDNSNEVTKGARPAQVAYWTFGAIAIPLVAIFLFLLPPHFFGTQNGLSGVILFLGLAGYATVAIISGLLYGANNAIKVVAMMMVSDVFLRFLFVGLVAFFGYDSISMQVAICLPFVLVPMLVFPLLKKYVAGFFRFDVSLKTFFLNSIQTVAAAGAMALLISGFPIIINQVYSHEDSQIIASAIFVVTLARAPLIIIAMSLQSYLISKLRKDNAISGYLKLVSTLICITSVIIAVLLCIVGNQLFGFISGKVIDLSLMMYFSVGISSGAVALLFVLGARLLAHDKHLQYVVMWLSTVLCTFGMIFIQIEPELLLPFILVLPPILGIVVGSYSSKSGTTNKLR